MASRRRSGSSGQRLGHQQPAAAAREDQAQGAVEGLAIRAPLQQLGGLGLDQRRAARGRPGAGSRPSARSGPGARPCRNGRAPVDAHDLEGAVAADEALVGHRQDRLGRTARSRRPASPARRSCVLLISAVGPLRPPWPPACPPAPRPGVSGCSSHQSASDSPAPVSARANASTRRGSPPSSSRTSESSAWIASRMRGHLPADRLALLTISSRSTRQPSWFSPTKPKNAPAPAARRSCQRAVGHVGLEHPVQQVPARPRQVGQVDALLGAEVVVDHRLGDAGLRGDGVHRRRRGSPRPRTRARRRRASAARARCGECACAWALSHTGTLPDRKVTHE